MSLAQAIESIDGNRTQTRPSEDFPGYFRTVCKKENVKYKFELITDMFTEEQRYPAGD